jgi:hypothetical protein
MNEQTTARSPGAAVYCPICNAQFGGMLHCPWDDSVLLPLVDADPTAVAFYQAIGASPARLSVQPTEKRP